MLAEPKFKTVLSVNPRGNHWYNDKQKIGHKLLSNMGWKDGNGLGKHQNGIKHQIKLNSNVNNNGLGFKSSYDSEWIADNYEYDQILQQLSVRYNTTTSIESTKSIINLEEKAKTFRNRVHYRSFIRAKNLSNYSENDIKSIFPKMTKIKNEEQFKCVELKHNQITSKMDLNQYFSLKMKKLNEKKVSPVINSESLPNVTKCLNGEKDETETNESKMVNEKSEEIIGSDLIANQSITKDKRIKRKKLNSKSVKSDVTTNISTLKKIKTKTNSCSENTIQLAEVDKNEFINVKNRHIVALKCDANQSIYNYDHICEAISNDKSLSTSNLNSICGYGINQ